jgi:predicted anti-sigma-YlaC factor YlaD
VNCLQYREALSARLDGEPLGMPDIALAGHLESCPGCAAWLEAATRITRLARISPADAVPDLSAEIVAAAGALAPPRRRAVTVLRLGLAVLALAQAVLAWPTLFLGQDGAAVPMHAAHEAGAWNLALAVAFFGVAARPSRAAALVPLLAVFVGVLAAVGLPDLALGHVTAARLATHLLVAAGLLFVVALARTTRRSPVAPAGGRGSGAAGGAGGRAAEGADAADAGPLDRPAAARERASSSGITGRDEVGRGSVA